VAEKHWSYEELGGADLGDQRRTKRLVAVTREMSQRPGRTIGASMDVAGAKAAYRLFNEPDVTPEAILAPHQKQTLARMTGEKVVLVAQDTTVLNFTTHEEADGFGGIGGGYSVNHGCFLHSALAFNEAGVPLGVLVVKQWSRAKAARKKESARWGEVVREIASMTAGRFPARVIHLADQEGDDWSLLSACAETKSSFVIRADGRRAVGPARRTVEPAANIASVMATAPVLGRHRVEVSAKALRKGHGSGKWSHGNDRLASLARRATVEVRAQTLTIPRTRTRTDGLKALTFTVVSVIEVDPPTGIKDPLEWFLMTDQPVTTLAEALRVSGWYKQRWAIETWHRTLKSGVKVEECRLSDYDRMQRFIALAAILAWRIDWMVRISREQPDTPVDGLLDQLEIEALKHSSRNRGRPLLTIRDAIRQIAALGGFAGRNSDGEPGSKTLWTGWLSLMERVDLLRSYQQDHKPKNVGKR
jgi:Transposase DNA-binding/Transposase Tn5 dimerisation domain